MQEAAGATYVVRDVLFIGVVDMSFQLREPLAKRDKRKGVSFELLRECLSHEAEYGVPVPLDRLWMHHVQRGRKVTFGILDGDDALGYGMHKSLRHHLRKRQKHNAPPRKFTHSVNTLRQHAQRDTRLYEDWNLNSRGHAPLGSPPGRTRLALSYEGRSLRPTLGTELS